MPTRRNSGRRHQATLTAEETSVAATRMMASAQAHQRAATWCTNNPDAQPPNIDFVFFSVVSFELLLLSVEQSLRLLLLLQYATVRDDTNHNPHVLYKAVRNKSGGKGGIRGQIIERINEIGRAATWPSITEKDLVSCLQKHDSSYSNFRYFQLDHRGRLNHDWEFTLKDSRILHCLALALISLNVDFMTRQGIGLWTSMSLVPESEITEDLNSLKERLTS